jgi:hypothetical protein
MRCIYRAKLTEPIIQAEICGELTDNNEMLFRKLFWTFAKIMKVHGKSILLNLKECNTFGP